MAGYGQNYAAQPIDRTMTEFDKLIDRFDKISMELETACGRCRGVADRVLGGVPEAVSGDAKGVPLGSKVARLENIAEQLSESIGRIHAAADRLEAYF